MKPQASFLGSSSASLSQNQEQTVDNSITVTKIPSASVPSSQSAKAEAPGMLEAKVPTSQMKQATPPPTAAAAKPTVSQTVNNSVFYNAINDEVVHFGNELAALRSRVNGINVQVSNITDILILRFVCFTSLLPLFSTFLSFILISLDLPVAILNFIPVCKVSLVIPFLLMCMIGVVTGQVVSSCHVISYTEKR